MGAPVRENCGVDGGQDGGGSSIVILRECLFVLHISSAFCSGGACIAVTRVCRGVSGVVGGGGMGTGVVLGVERRVGGLVPVEVAVGRRGRARGTHNGGDMRA